MEKQLSYGDNQHHKAIDISLLGYQIWGREDSLMNKRLVTLALGVALSTCSWSPAWAQTSTKATSSSVNPVARMASVVVGTVIGTPIAAVRRIGQLDNYAAKQWAKDYLNTESEVVRWPVRVWALAVSSVFSVPESPFWSFNNAWKYSADQPFSKEVFSLGDKLDSD